MSGATDTAGLSRLWRRIRELEGQTIPLVGTKTITIARVQPERETAVAITLADGTRRTVRRAEIDAAYEPGMPTVSIRPSTIAKNRPGMRNASYVAAILRAANG
jgi:hypothetical protein